MFKIITILLLLILELFAIPSWFEVREYTSKEGKYYGYGEGLNEKTARANALREISEQIHSNVESTISIQTNETTEYLSQDIDSKTFISSKQTLKHSKILKLKKEKNRVFVLMEHDYTTPFWFSSRSFEAPLFSVIGYGVGKSMQEATMDARSDISAQFSVNVSSSTYISSSYTKDESITDVKNKILSSTSSVIKESKIIKSEKVSKNYFVALIHKKVPQLQCVKQQNPFLKEIELIRQANTQTPCEYDYSLVRITSSWYLYADGFTQKLNYAQFDSFFSSINSQKLQISSEYSSYQADDVFKLEVKSKEDGFLSILVVYENGKVGVLLENRAIKKESLELFPKADDNFDMVAGLNEDNSATKDLYFAFVTPTRINLAEFETVSGSLLGEKEYRFNQVISLCSKYNFASTLIRTTPKNRVKRFEGIKQIEDTSFSWFFTDQLQSAIEDLPFKEKNPKKWAFIVSIEDYEFSDKIEYAQNSGNLFKLLAQRKLLVSDNQITFLEGKNATSENLSKKLKELASKVKKDDIVYFYFVGQGLPVPSQNNEPYLLAYDKSVASISKTPELKLANVYKTLASSKASQVTILLDTTFSGATDGVSIFKGVAAPKLKPKRVGFDKERMSVIVAGKDTQFTNKYSEKKHRMFTYFLIDGIVNQNIQEMKPLFEYVKTKVNKKSFELGDEFIQTPIIQGNSSF
ncbi:MAG: LPP20 family lipoprotein [Campylobacterota bacterium]|nr:LPP20 family lipoprotein [Campylobacterota bacterium]